MARKYARIKGSVWLDEDWRLLTPQAQWAYFMLLSQPHITNCGVVPYLPVRWARLARTLTVHHIQVLLAELEEHRFIVVDEDAGEILIRSFIRHDDGVEKVPNVRAAALKQYEEIESRLIRHTLAGEYPHLFTYTGPDPTIHRAQLPLPEPLQGRVAEPLGEGDNARVPSAFSLQPAASSARARDPHPDTPAGELPAAAGSPDGEEEHPLRATLAADPIAWKPWQITKGLADPDRCQAWVDQALTDPQIENPGGYTWSKFSKGDWPEQQITVAPGATGTRSVAPDLPHPCPRCGVGFKTADRLAEHVERVHAEHERVPPPTGLVDQILGRNGTDDDEPDPTEPKVGRGRKAGKA